MYAIIIVRIVTRLRAGKHRETGLNTDGGKRFFLSPKAHTGSGVRPISYSMFTMEFSPVSKAAGT